MWKSIKKFFKWIADHTGISWIARKISSGWNSVKNWWSGNKVSQVSVAIQTDTQIQKATLINSITEAGDKLILSISNDDLCTGFKNDKISELKSAHIQCNDSKFRVTFKEFLGLNNNTASYIISSIEPQKDEFVHDPRGKSSKKKSTNCQSVKTMRKTLGLGTNNPLVHVTQISKGPIMELMPEERANDDTPSSETASLETQPHAAGVYAGRNK
ncbi:MAG: hypothetical protein KTV72_03205 [Wolbachia endosymbiont of Melophagus ovinus]|nr:hypothetical protein [Wolbachia endosymbiont of Melophagus ovinus]